MKRRGTKLLIRIFLTFFLTALLILAGLAFITHSLKPEHSLSPMAEQNAVFYLNALQQKLGTAPSEESILNIYKDLHINARVQGFENLADQQGLPGFRELEKEDEHFSDKVVLGKYRGYFFAELRGASPRVVWMISAKEIPRGLAFPFIGIAGFILLILAMSFLTIRWIMSPVKVILQGVHKISMGDLKYRIKTRHRGGEFEMIGNTFNRMADGLEKMVASKEQLLRDVSHELRSPLTRVGVAVDLMSDEQLKVSIKEDLRKMEELVSEILESYRLKEGAASLRKAPTQMKELLENIVTDYKDVSPGVQLVEVADVTLQIDAMQIERVLRNLIENALKYTRTDSNPVLISLAKNHDEYVITVKDNGAGIDPKDLPHVFEPFYRADAARSPGKSGFGLGLAIAKSIVEAHDGELSAESTLGQGSRFTIRIPS